MSCVSGWEGDDCGTVTEDFRRILSSQQWLKSSVFFGAALAAIGFGFGIAGYYATKVMSYFYEHIDYTNFLRM